MGTLTTLCSGQQTAVLCLMSTTYVAATQSGASKAQDRPSTLRGAQLSPQ